MAQFKLLFMHLHGEIEENHNKPVRIAGVSVEV
jgi:hypothetical protein